LSNISKKEGRKMSKINPDLIDDLHAWIADLDEEEQAHIETLPDIIDLLPKFCKKWTLEQIWSAIRDY
jgi:hypothetical protein